MLAGGLLTLSRAEGGVKVQYGRDVLHDIVDDAHPGCGVMASRRFWHAGTRGAWHVVGILSRGWPGS
jgi:hypothetical protein